MNRMKEMLMAMASGGIVRFTAKPPDPNKWQVEPREDQLIAAVHRIEDNLSREGLDASAAAKYFGLSVSIWRSLDASGLCPAPAEIGVGRCPRWSRTELKAWLIAGSPSPQAC